MKNEGENEQWRKKDEKSYKFSVENHWSKIGN